MMALRRIASGASPAARAAVADSGWILPDGELRRVMDRERARSERNSHPFSLVSVDVSGLAPTALGRVVRVLRDRRRLTDDVGWFDNRRLGVVLAETPAGGARAYLDSLLQHLETLGIHLDGRVYGFGPGGPMEVGAGLGRRQDAPGEAGPPVSADAEVEDMAPLFWIPLPWWKRTIDVVGAGLLLLLLSPILLSIALAIKVSEPKASVVFRQKRAGRGGLPFDFYKFRTMRPDAEQLKEQLRALNEVSGPVFKMKRDPRVTRLGRILRKSSMDELPQLWNVLRGDMSLVGPRPPTLDEVPKYLAWQRRRLDCVGGITGLWQVSGRAEIPFVEWMRMDARYARTRSFLMDLKILFRTGWAVFSGRGAV